MNSNRPIDFTAAPVQATQGQMGFRSFLTDLKQFDKCINRLIRLFIEQVIDTTKVRRFERWRITVRRMRLTSPAKPPA